MRPFFRFSLRWCLRAVALAVAGALAVLATVWVVALLALTTAKSEKALPTGVSGAQVAVVLGAAAYPGGPSDMFADRLRTAAGWFFVQEDAQIIVSGASNEARVGADFLQELGVPANNILQDSRGTRTFETCRQLRQSGVGVGAQQAVVLVSQGYHLPRAILTCRALGLHAFGLRADLQPYRRIIFFSLREAPAMAVAAWDVAWFWLLGHSLLQAPEAGDARQAALR